MLSVLVSKLQLGSKTFIGQSRVSPEVGFVSD